MIDYIRMDYYLNNGDREYIMCAAIWLQIDKDFTHKPFNIDKGIVYSGWRHHQILEMIPLEYRGVSTEEGFLTNKNRFLNRTESLELAKSNGQVPKDINTNTLYSEDLW